VNFGILNCVGTAPRDYFNDGLGSEMPVKYSAVVKFYDSSSPSVFTVRGVIYDSGKVFFPEGLSMDTDTTFIVAKTISRHIMSKDVIIYKGEYRGNFSSIRLNNYESDSYIGAEGIKDAYLAVAKGLSLPTDLIEFMGPPNEGAYFNRTAVESLSLPDKNKFLDFCYRNHEG